MLSIVFWFVLGLIALIAGAELFVRSASSLAVRLGISKLIVGLTVVAFGTSAPELGVSIQAGSSGEADILLGNIVGSNLSNILLILGIGAVILPLRVNTKLIRTDVPIMIGVTVLLFLFALNGQITVWENATLVLIFIGYLLFLYQENKVAMREIEEKKKETGLETLVEEIPLPMIALVPMGIAGLTLLILGSRWLVGSAVSIAEILGISELVIGLTVVSIGTSLPEVVIVVVAAFKGERDIAVGNIVGSNILNIVLVLGTAGLVIPEPIPVQDVMLRFDFPVLILATIACLPIFFTGNKIGRIKGGTFLFMYFAYVLYLFMDATGSPLLEPFKRVMLFGVIPVAALVILINFIPEYRRRRLFYLAAKHRKRRKAEKVRQKQESRPNQEPKADKKSSSNPEPSSNPESNSNPESK
jgi:cation:H+ antiporter